MDHLPLPANPAHPRPSVPYLSTYIYDNGDWHTYPDRCGSSTNSLITGDYTAQPPATTGPLLQTWLYFGILTEVLGHHIHIEHWTRKTPSGSLVLDSSILPSQLEQWEDEIKASPTKEVRRQRLGRASKCLQTAGEVLNNAFVEPDKWPLSLEATLAVKILTDTITQMDVLWIYNVEDERDLGDAFRRIVYESYPDWLVRGRMERDGWCPNEKESIEGLGVSIAFLATEVRMPASATAHGMNMHERCKKGKCVAYNIEEGTYQTRHVEEGCRCSFQGPDKGDMEAILESGGYPVIFASRSANGAEELQMHAVRFEPGMEYVAISHCWSDGLGNATDTTLPTCQILKLISTIEALLVDNKEPEDSTWPNPTILFWMDTLCVPHAPALKNAAISLMNQTYSSATHVLVLSRTLQAISQPPSLEEFFIHLLRSSWMSRVWTFQEAILAKSLVVLLADGFASLTGIFEAYAVNIFRYNTAVKAAIFAFTPFVRRLAEKVDPVTKFGQTWDAMQTRSTSKTRDALIVFAIILGIKPTGDLLSHDLDTQTVEFFSHVGEVPRALLFCNVGQRVQREGFRWAPAGVLGKRDLIGDRSPAKLEGGGLVVKAYGYVFTPQATLKKGFLIKEVGIPMNASVDFDAGEGVPEEEENAKWAEIGPKAGSTKWGVLAIQPIASGAATAVYGVLVRIKGQRRDGVYECVYVANVSCERSQTAFHHDLPWAEPGEREQSFRRFPQLRELVADAENENNWLTWCIS